MGLDPIRAARRLAEVFADEPELILACVRGTPPSSRGEAQQVLSAARQALVLRPRYADLYFFAAHAAVVANEPDAAAGLLAQALELNPTYRDARVLAGRVALLRQRVEEARAHLSLALASGADYPDVHMLLGQASERVQDWPQARAAYQRALTLNSNLHAARAALATLPSGGADGVCHELPA
jgi:tetratricopeptide (TPR) repeat protein